MRLISNDDEDTQAPDERLAPQLDRPSVRLDDGGTVILTQWHEDHVGGLRDRPQATRGAHAEWDAGDMAVDGFGPMFDVPSFEGGETVGARDGRLRSVWEL